MISADLLSVLMRGIQARHLDWGGCSTPSDPVEEGFGEFFDAASLEPAESAAAVELPDRIAAAGRNPEVERDPLDIARAAEIVPEASPRACQEAPSDERAVPDAREVAAILFPLPTAVRERGETSATLKIAATLPGALPQADAPARERATPAEVLPDMRLAKPKVHAQAASPTTLESSTISRSEALGRAAESAGEVPAEDAVPPGDDPAPANRISPPPTAPTAAGHIPLGTLAPAGFAPADAAFHPGWHLSAEAPEAGAARDGGSVTPAAPASAVAGQVAVAIRASDSERIEIRLDPPELGRVQIEMRVVEGALHAVVVAERPEIGDILRRHAEGLQRDLQSAGYADVNLQFAAGREDGSERRQDENGGGRRHDLLALSPAPLQTAGSAGDKRLDIRL